MSTIDLTETILACERARCDALLAGDLAALADLLSDRLIFTHANGTTDTKETLLAKMSGGTIVYRSLVVDETRVLALAEGAALLAFRLTADLLVRGEPKRVRNLALSVWRIEKGAWKLIAYQPTALAPT